MARTIVEKIIDKHLIDENDQEVGIRIDQTLTQDATGTMVYLELESTGIDRVKTDLSVSYVDHNTLQCGYENADDHLYLRTIADNLGILFSPPGNGICHQVHLERFSVPKKTLLGSDSHTPTCGGVGSLAIGAGGIDVAAAMAGEPFYLPRPKSLLVELEGELSQKAEAKDVILSLLSRLTTKGNVGYIIEYGGKGVSTLSVPERATICNMGAELGVTTSIFPSDDVTAQFFSAQGRESEHRKLAADPDASYDKTVSIDLAEIEPLVAKPHSPDNVETVKANEKTPIQQICIGSCTNSSLYDMAVAGSILEGKNVAPGIDLVIAPGSRQVLQTIARMGILEKFIRSGARIMEPTCGFCIGNGQSPASSANSIRTSNRNFYGRSGTSSAGIYLTGVRVAATSALRGELSMPDEVDEGSEAILQAKSLEPIVIDDSQFIHPTGKETVVKGPNIGPPPTSRPLGNEIHGVVTIRVGDKITTDHIMPAGERLKYRSNISKYSDFVFERVDPDFHMEARANRNEGVANIIVAGSSYGQGSSREHAAICPAYLGVRAVVCKSIERIHRANLINFGIVPLTFKDEKDYEALQEGHKIEIRGIDHGLETGTFTLHDMTTHKKIRLEASFSEREQAYLRAGGKLPSIGGR